MSKNATKIKKLGGGVKPIKKIKPTVLLCNAYREGFLVRVFAQAGVIIVNVHLWKDRYFTNEIAISYFQSQTLDQIIDQCFKEAKEYTVPVEGNSAEG
jgi:hypothetical protein